MLKGKSESWPTYRSKRSCKSKCAGALKSRENERKRINAEAPLKLAEAMRGWAGGMKSRPILFSAPMVLALLDGRKTITRRIVKLPRDLAGGDLSKAWPDKMFGVTPGLHVPMPDGTVQRLRNPWGWPEPSRLWVRETFCLESTYDYHGYHSAPDDNRPIQKHDDNADGSYWLIPHYRATEPEPNIVPYRCDADDDRTRWTPSIFMPRWASRITLEVTGVRAERLQDINRGDAMDEGCPFPNMAHGDDPRQWYAGLWDQINGHGSWDLNPWVWVISIARIEV